MSITTELREWTKNNTVWGESLTTYPVQHPVYGTREELAAIADRIDAEYKKAIQELNGFAESSELLPKDVNGEPIHIGDAMELDVDYNKSHFEVRALRLDENGWEIIDRLGDRYLPYKLHHYHPPTVEDMLKEFIQEINENMGMYTSEVIDADEWRNEDNAIITKYATKLKLKESE